MKNENGSAQAVIPSVERGIFDAHTMKFIQRMRVKDSSLRSEWQPDEFRGAGRVQRAPTSVPLSPRESGHREDVGSHPERFDRPARRSALVRRSQAALCSRQLGERCLFQRRALGRWR